MKIANLFVYPIKSCGGISLGELQLTPAGPVWDRMFVLTDENGVFLSQRTAPRMCLIHTDVGDNPNGPPGSVAVFVEAPGMPREFIPLSLGEFFRSGDAGAFRERSITIHKDTCGGIDLGDHYAEWFTKFLGTPCRLVRQVSRIPRNRKISALANREIKVSFADGYPLLVLSEASLADLNARIVARGGKALPMNRFRPNIVLTDCEPYAEDALDMWGVRHAAIQTVKPCVRCVITVTDQHTAERGKEPLATLSTYRKNGDGGVIFGMNCIVEEVGVVRVGDSIETG
ncbi:MAG: MOSC domain-containing protein [bacterium]|nr:MOSC domain-containing protein [bacterium]